MIRLLSLLPRRGLVFALVGRSNSMACRPRIRRLAGVDLFERGFDAPRLAMPADVDLGGVPPPGEAGDPNSRSAWPGGACRVGGRLQPVDLADFASLQHKLLKVLQEPRVDVRELVDVGDAHPRLAYRRKKIRSAFGVASLFSNLIERRLGVCPPQVLFATATARSARSRGRECPLQQFLEGSAAWPSFRRPTSSAPSAPDRLPETSRSPAGSW